jgi:hypothetical protein
VNEHLRTIDESIDDLEVDLSDGIKLIHLVQVRALLDSNFFKIEF